MAILRIVLKAASLLLAASIVSAAPAHIKVIDEVRVLGGDTFRIHQVQNTKYKGVTPGPMAYAGALIKFGVSLPDYLQAILDDLAAAAANSSSDDGEGELTPARRS